jgi:hypothetical protein
MPVPREIVDALESVLGVYFSGVRHRERAAFILCDELVEVACKLRARQHDRKFRMDCTFHAAWHAPGVAIPENPLGQSIQDSRNTRNTMQHVSPAATVDAQHCADAIMDAVSVIEHCWPGASTAHFPDWVRCALRIVRLYSRNGDPGKRQSFEDAMRDGAWRASERPPRRNEIAIQVGRREYWTLLMIQSQVQVEGVLDALGIP